MTRSLLRFAVAALAIAAALYLIPASVHIVAWPLTGPARLALLPPLSRWWWSLAASALLFGAVAAVSRQNDAECDRRSNAVAPLALLLLWVVPYLPWLGDRAPLLLLLAGPARWLVVAIAIGWTIARVSPALTWRMPAASRTVVFVVSLLLYAALGVRFTAAAGFGGDEPHYLVITHSLLVDHDLDIANNHEHRDYKAFYGGELRPDYLQRSQDGRIYSIHAPGLPVLLLPAYAAGGAYGTVVAVALLAALTALAIFDLAALLTSPASATLVWLGVCLTVPFIPHAWLIYPELPGALVVACSVLCLGRTRSPAQLVIFGLLLASLPWLHTKFVVLLALFAVLESLHLGTRFKQLMLFATPIGVSLVGWLYFFYRTYGTLDPEAPYGSSTQLNVLIQNIPHGVLGLLFDQKFGVLVYSPVYALALVGVLMMARDRTLRLFAAELVLVSTLFLLSTTRFYMWWGGSSAPARFFVPVIPLAAVPIAVAVDRLRGAAGRAFVMSTLVVSVGVAGACLIAPRAPFLFNEPHGLSALVQALQGSAPLDVALPTFTEENWHAPLGLLALWLAAFGLACAVTLGVMRTGRLRSSWAAGVLTVILCGATASAFDGGRISGRDASRRAAVATRGQLAAMHAFDAASLRAVDLTTRHRIAGDDLLAKLTLGVVRTPGDVAQPTGIAEPFDLPEGEYEARLWFDAASGRSGNLTATLSPHVVLATTVAPFQNPAILRFRLLVPAPVQLALSEPASAAAWRRVDIAPVVLAAGEARSGLHVTGVEPIDGRAHAYMAYTDDHAYPEGGVFWTRGTDTARLAIVPAGATALHLILLVGPAGGRVSATVGAQQLALDLNPNETRDVTIPLPPGALTVPLSVASSRDFRPADVDHASDDQRRLGCQVRPRLDPS